MRTESTTKIQRMRKGITPKKAEAFPEEAVIPTTEGIEMIMVRAEDIGRTILKTEGIGQKEIRVMEIPEENSVRMADKATEAHLTEMETPNRDSEEMETGITVNHIRRILVEIIPHMIRIKMKM